jgi:hypothetical protein
MSDAPPDAAAAQRPRPRPDASVVAKSSAVFDDALSQGDAIRIAHFEDARFADDVSCSSLIVEEATTKSVERDVDMTEFFSDLFSRETGDDGRTLPSAVVAAPSGGNRSAEVTAAAPAAPVLPWAAVAPLPCSRPVGDGRSPPPGAAAPASLPPGRQPVPASGVGANAAWADIVSAVAPPAQADASARAGNVVCVYCQYPGADVRVRCPSGCAYHARCLDLLPLCGHGKRPSPGSPASPERSGWKRFFDGPANADSCGNCSRCALPVTGVEILPLDFTELDRVQQVARARCAVTSRASGAKRSHDDLESLPVLLDAETRFGTHAPKTLAQCYDPARPRTGRWTGAEILFRDALIAHFLAGSPPLRAGLKLSDFLTGMLKSKPSRLAKKMKHAQLSTRRFHPEAGHVAAAAARELSRLEREFVASIANPVERSEIRFHMGREWQTHFVRRCVALALMADGSA